MKPRLELLRMLLSDDGSIWISIDDYEYAYLKILGDEIFGRSNFVTTIIWQMRKSRENRKAFSNNHEYLIVFAKNYKKFAEIRNSLNLNETIKSRYKNPDNDPRGVWQSVSANAQAGHATKSQFYTLISPNGKEHTLPKGRCWLYTKEKMQQEIENGNIWFGLDGNGVPRIKKFLRDIKGGLTPETLWLSDEVGTNDSAKKMLLNMFPDETVFETPKPEELIQQILHISSNYGDLVLDSFLGSGTTSAVAHKMGRKWIGIELGDHAYTHCYPRLKAVVDGEQGGISKSVNWQGGGGFKFYELAPTLLEQSKRGILCISDKYNEEMLAQAMAKHEGYSYCPNNTTFWKQGFSGDSNFIFTTTGYISPKYLDNIASGLSDSEYLLICAESFDTACIDRHKNITIAPIPKMLLGRCEWGKDSYDLNILLDGNENWNDNELEGEEDA